MDKSRMFLDPWEARRNDPMVRRVTDMLTNLIMQCELSPVEVRQCAMMAAIRAESMVLDNGPVFVRDYNYNLKPMVKNG